MPNDRSCSISPCLIVMYDWKFLCVANSSVQLKMTQVFAFHLDREPWLVCDSSHICRYGKRLLRNVHYVWVWSLLSRQTGRLYPVWNTKCNFAHDHATQYTLHNICWCLLKSTSGFVEYLLGICNLKLIACLILCHGDQGDTYCKYCCDYCCFRYEI